MKRLYFLFLSIFGTIIYSSEHSQEPSSSERRGSIVAMLERRSSSIKKFLLGKDGQEQIKQENTKPLSRRRTRSAGDAVVRYHNKSSLMTQSSLPDLNDSIKELKDNEDSLFKEAIKYLDASKNERDPHVRQKLRIHAEVDLEILRREKKHPKAIQLLLEEFYTQDFDIRSSEQLSSFEKSLLEDCGGQTDLLVLYNQLRVRKLTTATDEFVFDRFKNAFLALIHLRESDEFNEEKVQKFAQHVQELATRKKFLKNAAQPQVDKESLEVDKESHEDQRLAG